MNYCLDCGGKIVGRTDKKFCDDYCRGHYHNKQNRGKNVQQKEINRILKKNARILERFNETGTNTLSREILSAAGFDFNFFTHQICETDGQLYHFCYNYGYGFHDENGLVIKVMQDRKKL